MREAAEARAPASFTGVVMPETPSGDTHGTPLAGMAVLMTGAWLLQGQPVAVMAWVFIMALLPMPLYAAKTRGGWKWRGPGGS